MVNETVLYLPHTDCNHPLLKKHAKELDISVMWNPDLRLGAPLHEVFANVLRYDIGSNYANSGVLKTNTEITNLVIKNQPKYVIWPTMSYEIQESTFQVIRKSGAYVVGWFFDDEMRFENYSRWWIPCMDFILTGDQESVDKYRGLGASAFHLLVTSNPYLFRQLGIPKSYDVSFVGSAGVSDRVKTAGILRNNGINIETFGSGWQSGYVTDEEIVKIYNSSKINLCLTKAYADKARNQLKSKIFDICMSGGFLYVSMCLE